MKRTIGTIGLTILSAWFVMPGMLFGQSDQEQPAEQDVEAVEEEEGGDAEAEKDGLEDESRLRETKRKGRRAKDDARTLVRQLAKLRDAVKKKIELSSKQEEVIDELFDEHLRKLKERQRESKSGQEGAEVGQSEVRALRGELTEAAEAGDREAIREIRGRLRRAMRAHRLGGAGGTAQFLEKVKEELDKEQQKTFRAILKRLKLDRFSAPADLPLRRLMQAVMNPDIELSPEQSVKIRTIMREAFATTRPDASDRDRLTEIAERLRVEIFAELSDEQQAKVEASLKSEDGRAHRGDRRRQPHRRRIEEDKRVGGDNAGEEQPGSSGEADGGDETEPD